MASTYVLLDDDPTGPQLSAGVPVVLDPAPEVVREALRHTPAALHIITNSRAAEPADAYRLTRAAAEAAVAGGPCRLVLRGDSTLRGHLFEEYRAVRDVVYPGRTPPLLLVPALPSAGRVTVDGVHCLQRDGGLVPLSATEYARDGGFAYPSARLLDYAEHRSRGFFPAARGRQVPASAPHQLVDALCAAAADGPAAVAVDAATDADLVAVRQALDTAGAAGIPVICRCAPALAALLAGESATSSPVSPVEPPATPHGVLVVCGSYVQNTTAQLAALRQRTGASVIEADVAALAGAAAGGIGSDKAELEVARLASAASTALRTDRLAVISTPRVRPAGLLDLARGERIAAGLARAAAAVRPAPSVVLTKGGITSAVVLRDGFGVSVARTVGPLAPGVSLWRAIDRPPFVVFPGNVGGVDALVEVVLRLLGTLPN